MIAPNKQPGDVGKGGRKIKLEIVDEKELGDDGRKNVTSSSDSDCGLKNNNNIGRVNLEFSNKRRKIHGHDDEGRKQSKY